MLLNLIHHQHDDLQELFMQHQESLLQIKIHDALYRLNGFTTCLFQHIALEEQFLFPEFSRIRRKSRWNINLYEKEHMKIRELNKNLTDDLAWLHDQQLNDSDLRRNIIALIDKEKTFKGLLEHHELREEDAMLTELDDQLSDSHLQEISESIQSMWSETVSRI